MVLQVGGGDFSVLLESVIGKGRLILLRYGPGSGGELLLKEFISSAPAGTNGIMISTYETTDEINGASKLSGSSHIEVLSLTDLIESDIEMIRRRDRFVSEGILVTDILELSMADDYHPKIGPGRDLLSAITKTALKQVLPFRFALDSVSDLVGVLDPDPVRSRLSILRTAARDMKGTAIVGAPSGWNGFGILEHRIFDAVIETRAMKTGTTWERVLIMTHLRNGVTPPQQWPISGVK